MGQVGSAGKVFALPVCINIVLVLAYPDPEAWMGIVLLTITIMDHQVGMVLEMELALEVVSVEFLLYRLQQRFYLDRCPQFQRWMRREKRRVRENKQYCDLRYHIQWTQISEGTFLFGLYVELIKIVISCSTKICRKVKSYTLFPKYLEDKYSWPSRNFLQLILTICCIQHIKCSFWLNSIRFQGYEKKMNIGFNNVIF